MSSGRAQIAVVKDANNNKLRKYIDFSQTVNLFTELDAYPLPRIETLINDLAMCFQRSTYTVHTIKT